MLVPCFQTSFAEDAVLSLMCIYDLCQNGVSIAVHVSFLFFCSISLVHMSASVLASCWFHYCGSVVQLEVRDTDCPSTAASAQD